MPNNQEKGIFTPAEGGPEVGPTGNNHLLVIAIDEYVHCPKLRNCVKDAKEFAELLWERYRFDREHTCFLLNGEATRPNILNTIRDLRTKVKECDSLVIYYSGHGQTVDEVGYWIPVDAAADSEVDFVSTLELKPRLDAINSFHTFLIADACFSGALFLQFKDTPVAAGEEKRSRWGLAASHSREKALDGTPGENSPFAERLLKNLRHNTESLGIQKLAVTLIDEVYVTSGQRQTPVFKNLNVKGDELGQFVFKLRNAQPLNVEAVAHLEDIEIFIRNGPQEPLLEEAWWQRALRMDSAKGYDDYLDHYPGGKHKAEALSGLALKEEEELWQECKKENTKAAYQKYRTTYPNGRYAADALRLKSGLEAKPKDTAPAVQEAKPAPPAKKSPASKETPKPVPRPRDIPVPRPAMVLIPGGTFQMGNVMGDKEYEDEMVHTVTLSAFQIGAYEVTFEEYDAFCDATGREKPDDGGWGRGRRPVINVSWEDAIAYCNWLSTQHGYQPVYSINGGNSTARREANGYRLPTEAEWEYAAREGGKRVRFGNGKDIADPKEINFHGGELFKKSYSVIGEYRGRTVNVGSFAPNALGLYDMSGNVWEWCQDWYGDYPSSAQTNPRGPDRASHRVYRGGSWSYSAQFCRPSNRSYYTPSSRYNALGFRLAL